MLTTPVYNYTITMMGMTTNYTNVSKNLELEKSRGHFLYIMTPTIVFLTAVAVVGAVGNSLVLLVYTRSFSSKPTRIFILTLSFLDLITNLFVIPVDIYDLFEYWTFDRPSICRAKRFMYTFNTIGSSLALLAICATRYQKICKPFGRQVTVYSAKVICLILALVSLLFAAPTAIVRSSLLSKTSGPQCKTFDDKTSSDWPVLNAGVFILLFILTAIPLVVLYILIGVKAKQRVSRISSLAKKVNKAETAFVRESDKSSIESIDRCSSTTTSELSRQNVDIHKLTVDVEVNSETDQEQIQNVKCESSKKETPGNSSGELKETDDIAETKDKQEVNVSSDQVMNNVSSKENIVCSSNLAEISRESTASSKQDVGSHKLKKSNANESRSYENKEINTKSKKISKINATSVNLRKKLQKSVSKVDKKRKMSTTIKGSSRTTFMLATITIVFILTFLPFLIALFCTLAAPKFFTNLSPQMESVYEFMLRSYLLNTAVNPIIYNLCDVNFRRECLKLLKFW